jgi:hypothetical protein
VNAPKMVYVLQIVSPDSASLPAVFGSLRSAKRAAAIGWVDGGSGDPEWTDDGTDDVLVASPAAGVRFVISSQLVQP